MYNPDFNTVAYEEIMSEAGLNRFIMSVKQWVSRTNSKGIVAKAGRYGGTYAIIFFHLHMLEKSGIIPI